MLKLTEKDKKLLLMLAVFVLIFGVGLYVVRPLARKNEELKEELGRAQMEMSGKMQKVALLNTAAQRREDALQALNAQQEKFYPWMEADELENTLTGMALSLGLDVSKLELEMPVSGTYADVKSYLEPEDSGEEEKELIGVYEADAEMAVAGDYEALWDLLDACAALEPAVRIQSFSWSGEDQLSLSLALYMYEDEGEYLGESLNETEGM